MTQVAFSLGPKSGRSAVIPSGGGGFPLAGTGSERIGMGRPVVEGCRVEVCAVRPDKGMHFGVDENLIEKGEVAQRPEEFPGEDWAKIDHLLRGVIEPDAKGIGPHYLE
jgi:hypothetical protein